MFKAAAPKRGVNPALRQISCVQMRPVVNPDLEEDLVREVAESHSGTAGERVFGSNHDHKRAAEDFFGLKLLGTGEPG